MRGDADRGEREHAVRDNSAEDAARYLGRDVGEHVAPADPAEARVGERDDWVEVPARDGAEHQDDRVQPRRRCGRVLEQLEAHIARGERLRRDARADHERGQER